LAHREVEDPVGAQLLLESGALIEHAADPRRLLEIVGDGPGDDHGPEYILRTQAGRSAADADRLRIIGRRELCPRGQALAGDLQLPAAARDEGLGDAV